jgi:hypothetical protein
MSHITQETVNQRLKSNETSTSSGDSGKLRMNGPTNIPVNKAHFWETDRVLRWLKKYCNPYYNECSELFKKHDITGQVLMTLTDQKLLRLGITNSLHRQDILLQILKLKLSWDRYQLEELQNADEQ